MELSKVSMMNTELQTTLNSTVDALTHQQDLNSHLLREKEEFVVNFDNVQRERDRYLMNTGGRGGRGGRERERRERGEGVGALAGLFP
jgi:hypothetical protein